MILDPRGKIGNSMVVEDRIAKRQSGRRIPLHRDLRTALSQLRKLGPEDGPVIRSSRGGSMKPNSIVKEPFQAERMAQEFGGETYDILDRGKGSGWEKWRRKETPNKFARYG
ncbi:hypothetical protein LB550_13615 [Mesorhizobium sp. BR1-1-14]|nr:hypothetical protein [Mesorhizobium sp. BR1-1-14]MBZ9959330.1 hypothetical protein [Mesorhizobium sp. BR1-1-14]